MITQLFVIPLFESVFAGIVQHILSHAACCNQLISANFIPSIGDSLFSSEEWVRAGKPATKKKRAITALEIFKNIFKAAKTF